LRKVQHKSCLLIRCMGKETDEVRIIQFHVIPDEKGWVKLPQNLLRAIGVTPGNLLSFIADEHGFRVTGTTKPPYLHASTEQPPDTLQAPVPEMHTEIAEQTLSAEPQHEEPTPPPKFSDATQRQLFDPGQPQKPIYRKEKK
jgi:hypothetical protein